MNTFLVVLGFAGGVYLISIVPKCSWRAMEAGTGGGNDASPDDSTLPTESSEDPR